MMSNRSLLSLVVLATVVLGGCSRQEAAAPASKGGRGGGAGQKQVVEVTSVERRDLYETMTVVGSLESNEAADIRPEIAGLVKAIFFDEGQPVKQGQVLAKIDDSELLAQYAQVEARFKLSELNVARSENLSESRTIPQAEVDRARAEFASARAELSLLRLRLEKTEVKAPFDGVVGSRTISPGDYVTASTTLTRINDLSRMKVSFQVPERFLSKVHHGTRFDVLARTVDASEKITGEVYFVSSVIDRSTRSSEVKGLLKNPSPALRPGMFANVEIILDVRRGALTVPEGAVLSSASGPQLITVNDSGDDKTAEFVPVQLGLRVRGWVEVTPLQGKLTADQTIVASGVGSLILYPGMKLEPRPLRREFQRSVN